MNSAIIVDATKKRPQRGRFIILETGCPLLDQPRLLLKVALVQIENWLAPQPSAPCSSGILPLFRSSCRILDIYTYYFIS